MISRIFLALGSFAISSSAWAHPGHVADLGHGHAHWAAYAIGAGVLLGLAIWGACKLYSFRKSAPAKRT